MLKIMIENATLTCLQSGQVIDVSLAKDSWLHEGSIICPPCDLFCDDCSNSESYSLDDLQDDPNAEFKQTLEDVECKGRPRGSILGFLQSLGFNPDSFT